ncbi:MAG: endonuclease/exonuclease/phosphatase family protein [Desulfuromonadales bacterium]
MYTIRVMTYNIRRCRGGDGVTSSGRVAKVIGDGAPDLVALQDLDAGGRECQLSRLGERLGMSWYGPIKTGSNGILSYYPLRGIREYSLGGDGVCLRGDLDFRGQRIHLFNVRLDSRLEWRRRQLASLLGEDLLGNRALACPIVVLGDFSNLHWAGGFGLSASLKQAKRPLWSGTYPARFPVVARDRVYLCKRIKVIDTRIMRGQKERVASAHLPYLLTLQIRDTGTYLHVKKMSRAPMEPAAG